MIAGRLSRGLGRGITRNLFALAIVGLLTDISSEMLVAPHERSERSACYSW